MRTVLASFVALLLLAGCGDESEGGSGVETGEGCLIADEEGRPLQCWLWTGSGMQHMPTGTFMCPTNEVNVKAVRSCPRGESYVGRCTKELMENLKQVHTYYAPEGDKEDAALIYEGMCDGLDGVWAR